LVFGRNGNTAKPLRASANAAIRNGVSFLSARHTPIASHRAFVDQRHNGADLVKARLKAIDLPAEVEKCLSLSRSRDLAVRLIEPDAGAGETDRIGDLKGFMKPFRTGVGVGQHDASGEAASYVLGAHL